MGEERERERETGRWRGLETGRQRERESGTGLERAREDMTEDRSVPVPVRATLTFTMASLV